MEPSSRFLSPARHLSLQSLARKGGLVCVLFFFVALFLHASLTRLGALRAQAAPAKPLSTQFVKRAPRLTKPLELRKRPKPKRRRVERSMVSVKPQAAPADARAPVRPPDLLHVQDVAVTDRDPVGGVRLDGRVQAGHALSFCPAWACRVVPLSRRRCRRGCPAARRRPSRRHLW